MKISIAIPCYEYGGKGGECLEYSFNKINEQTFRDFNVIISDHSKDDVVEEVCKKWKNKFEIKYIRNENDRGNASANINNTILNADGDWIKILCQDDYFLFDYSLEVLSKHLNNTAFWLASGYVHTNDRTNYYHYHFPQLNPNIYIVNTIGTPSCIAIKNDNSLLEFDTNLTYCYDCEYYYRLILEKGQPNLITDINIANFLWDESTSSGITQEVIDRENRYILEKHNL